MKLGLLIRTIVSLTMMTAAAAGQGSTGRSLLAPQLDGGQDRTDRSLLGRPNWEFSPTLPRNPQPYDRQYPGSRKLSS
jgi:hypothetical protein